MIQSNLTGQTISNNYQEIIFERRPNEKVRITVGMLEITAKIQEEKSVLMEDLLAICSKESSCNSEAIGDNGHAIGAFQINTLYHQDQADCAKDFECAANWTADRMIRLGYTTKKADRKYAILAHNGVTPGNTYGEVVFGYAERIRKLIDNQITVVSDVMVASLTPIDDLWQNGAWGGQCAYFVNKYIGRTIITAGIGTRKKLIDSDEPANEAIFVANPNYNGIGHVGIVKKVVSPDEIHVLHSNWNNDNRISRNHLTKVDGKWIDDNGVDYNVLGFIVNY